jgi:hypothetical protein
MVFLFIALLHWPNLKEKNKYNKKIYLFITVLHDVKQIAVVRVRVHI